MEKINEKGVSGKAPMFVPRKCSFDKERDLKEVDQFGYINLRDAFENGAVEGAVSFDMEKYNGISDASVLMHRPQDVFEATRQSDFVKSVLRAAKNTEQTAPDGTKE